MVPADKDENDSYFAMKIVKRSKLMQNTVVAELEALKRLMHPNIIQLHEVIDDPSIDSLHLVIDLIEGGTLETKIKNGLSKQLLQKWSREIVSAVLYCHTVANICHRDLKAENVMINS